MKVSFIQGIRVIDMFAGIISFFLFCKYQTFTCMTSCNVFNVEPNIWIDQFFKNVFVKVGFMKLNI